MCKKIYIIGNGFDLHHNLPTDYFSFKKFVRNLDAGLIQKIDYIFEERGCHPDEIQWWSTLEEMLKTISEFDYEQSFQNAFDGAEDDMDRASYWHDPKLYADIEAKELLIPIKLKEYFDIWVKSINFSKVEADPNIRFESDDIFITFNYTDTLQRIYKIDNNNILHIHGQIESEFILGHNDKFCLPYSDPYELYIDQNGDQTSDEDIRSVEVRESINSTYEFLYRKYHKNSKRIIEDNHVWFKKISHIDKIVFMGLSMGFEDLIYLEEMSKYIMKTCEIEVYYRNNFDYISQTIESYFASNIIKYFIW
ncbi:hypothetical protein BK010_07275 [Tenericutes bacterium MO-XQ]|nr:hypothetical protein BK010_07275 [Tenericutes bacterium MO-XQ]